MITITIPAIPSLLAISSFIALLIVEIDDWYWISTILVSALVFFASYGFFTMLGAF